MRGLFFSSRMESRHIKVFVPSALTVAFFASVAGDFLTILMPLGLPTHAALSTAAVAMGVASALFFRALRLLPWHALLASVGVGLVVVAAFYVRLHGKVADALNIAEALVGVWLIVRFLSEGPLGLGWQPIAE